MCLRKVPIKARGAATCTSLKLLNLIRPICGLKCHYRRAFGGNTVHDKQAITEEYPELSVNVSWGLDRRARAGLKRANQLQER